MARSYGSSDQIKQNLPFFGRFLLPRKLPIFVKKMSHIFQNLVFEKSDRDTLLNVLQMEEE